MTVERESIDFDVLFVGGGPASLAGAVKLMQDLKADPVELRRRVTSPGGTTEAALNVLEGHNVKNQIVTAISAATRRSKELSQ